MYIDICMRVFGRETETECVYIHIETECVYIYIDVGSICKEKENKIGARRCENKKGMPTPNNPTQGALASLAENSLVPYPLPNPTESRKKEAWPNIADSVQRARHVCLKLRVDTHPILALILALTPKHAYVHV